MVTRASSIAAIAIAATIVLSSCAANEAAPSTSGSAAPVSKLSGTLNGIGSSAQGAAQTAWIAGFQTSNPKVTINYDPQGSGAGRTNFISGAADFAGSDAALKDTEIATPSPLCKSGTKAIDLPVYISPIAIAYNVAGLKDLKLDAATIAGIFKGAITKWDDAAIKSLNSGATLPSAPITVVHRSDDSGTTQNFTDYLSANAPTVWDKPAAQTFPYAVGDAAKGTSGVADAVKGAANSIAYIDESGATGLGIAQLKVGDSFVKINAAGAADVVAKSPAATGRGTNDLAIAIDRKNTDKNAWPLVLVSYLIVCNTYDDAAKGSLVKAYASYVASAEGQAAAATQAGSSPLAKDLAAKVAAAIATIK
ncbi:phosphate ABC transporter substrate-binding protein PstS [Lacisediminihabitans profunda]|uniref:Phosphate-binding protein n=1 Tax=Lacisediminihabitans profunda TaxID=2594790 RepID=A0A5C8UYF4_9MICO|nr:phosphate ABC transporter substrate-binding protein PstS [Lacisediminihabitans profunda]TXN32729.1 phosphate ABC transporter substrate-binding protein PstS [Lacisediminihabitans profunda]